MKYGCRSAQYYLNVVVHRPEGKPLDNDKLAWGRSEDLDRKRSSTVVKSL